MNKKNILLIIIIIALSALSLFLYTTLSTIKNESSVEQEQTFDDEDSFDSQEFSDGLPNPSSTVKYALDEFDTGVSEKYTYNIDINKDGKPDRITKTFFETGNAHAYYKYTVELNENGKYVDITPPGLQTTNGADCDLQQIQFRFKPSFQITMIYREMGDDTWNDPTTAYKRVFSLQDNKLSASKDIKMRPICDVKELF